MSATTTRQVNVGYIWLGGGVREGMEQEGVDIGQAIATADKNGQQDQRTEATAGTDHV